MSTPTSRPASRSPNGAAVEKLDDTIEKAKGAGGRLAAGPFEMAEVGRIAIMADPQGAFVSLYEPEREGPPSEGVFVWDELGTTDVDGAQGFYEEFFGWTTSDTGSDYYGGYHVFNRDETGIAGLMTLADQSIPPRLQPASRSTIPTRRRRRRPSSAARCSLNRWTCPGWGGSPSSATRTARTSGSSSPSPHRSLVHRRRGPVRRPERRRPLVASR